MSKISNAVKVLTKALREDKEFYCSYQANIAMAFKDEYARSGGKENIHELANRAADNFMQLWIKETSK